MLQLSGRSSAPEVLVHSQCATPRTLFVSLLQAPKAEEQSHRDTSRRCGLSVSLDTALQLWMGGKNAKKCIVPSHVGSKTKRVSPIFPGRGTANPHTRTHFIFCWCRGSPLWRTALGRTLLDAFTYVDAVQSFMHPFMQSFMQ